MKPVVSSLVALAIAIAPLAAMAPDRSTHGPAVWAWPAVGGSRFIWSPRGALRSGAMCARRIAGKRVAYIQSHIMTVHASSATIGWKIGLIILRLPSGNPQLPHELQRRLVQQRLADRGLVSHTPYVGVHLTDVMNWFMSADQTAPLLTSASTQYVRLPQDPELVPDSYAVTWQYKDFVASLSNTMIPSGFSS